MPFSREGLPPRLSGLIFHVILKDPGPKELDTTLLFARLILQKPYAIGNEQVLSYGAL